VTTVLQLPVYNQAIVVPETIDAIRALTGIEQDGLKSIAKTDEAMGLVREFISRYRSTSR
jgi:glyceraldehyde-3-phosphate dehydrogenase (NAD(P))